MSIFRFKNAFTPHLIDSKGEPFHKDSESGLNFNWSERTFLQSSVKTLNKVCDARGTGTLRLSRTTTVNLEQEQPPPIMFLVFLHDFLCWPRTHGPKAVVGGCQENSVNT